MPVKFRLSFVLTIVVIGLSGCATKPTVDPFGSEGRVWPEPPDVKRIAFVGEFSNAADLGIKSGAWTRIINFAAGPRNSSMVRPMAVATSGDGNVIFVADPDARCVHRYDLARGRYACITISREEALVSPVGLAVANSGRLYVTDSRLGHIYHVPVDGKSLERLKLDVELKQPTGVVWDPVRQLLFVTDTGSQSIKVFDEDGSLVREFGGRGATPGEFNFPTYLWVDRHGDLLVTDSLNFRIQRFGDDAEFLHEFGGNGDRAGDLPRPKGVATDRFGHVYVVDALFNALQIFDKQGQLLLSIGGRGQEVGEFWLPNGVFVGHGDTIYVADSQNKRVQVFRYIGPDE